MERISERWRIMVVTFPLLYSTLHPTILMLAKLGRKCGRSSVITLISCSCLALRLRPGNGRGIQRTGNLSREENMCIEDLLPQGGKSAAGGWGLVLLPRPVMPPHNPLAVSCLLITPLLCHNAFAVSCLLITLLLLPSAVMPPHKPSQRVRSS